MHGSESRTVVLVQLAADSPDAAHFTRALAEAPPCELRFAEGEAALVHAADCEVFVASHLPEAFLARAPRLRWVSFLSAGVDGQLSEALRAATLRITSAVGVHGPNIAEHLIAFMLTFTHGLQLQWRDQQARLWRDWSGSRAQGSELWGQTLVIIGLGQIGGALAERAHAFGMRVVGIKRDPTTLPKGMPEHCVDAVFGPSQIDAVLGVADHLALCAPLTAETTHLFDAARIARLKRGAYLYNIARGGLVDTAALIAALRSGALAGAGLDVFETEPLPTQSPLWDLPNVLITPHSAGLTPRYYERAAALFSENFKRYLSNQPLLQAYDPRRGY